MTDSDGAARVWKQLPLMCFAMAIGWFLLKSFYPAQFPGHLLVVPRLGMQIYLTVLLTSASLYIILSKKFTAKDKYWAFGTIGTIVGFWLRG